MLNYEALISGLMGAFAGFVLGAVLIGIALVVILIVGEWKLFVKAGKEGWKSIIPFYNIYVFTTEICGLHWVFSLVLIVTSIFSLSIPFLGIALAIIRGMAIYNLATKCKQENVIIPAIFGAIAQEIFIVVYGLSKKTVYDKKVAVNQYSFFSKF